MNDLRADVALDVAVSQLNIESKEPDEIDPVMEFAAWLTTRPNVISVGATETVYAMFGALEEFQAIKLEHIKAKPAASPQPLSEEVK